jgi:hypothetical protein
MLSDAGEFTIVKWKPVEEFTVNWTTRTISVARQRIIRVTDDDGDTTDTKELWRVSLDRNSANRDAIMAELFGENVAAGLVTLLWPTETA